MCDRKLGHQAFITVPPRSAQGSWRASPPSALAYALGISHGISHAICDGVPHGIPITLLIACGTCCVCRISMCNKPRRSQCVATDMNLIIDQSRRTRQFTLVNFVPCTNSRSRVCFYGIGFGDGVGGGVRHCLEFIHLVLG